jgi:hypothetical protein
MLRRARVATNADEIIDPLIFLAAGGDRFSSMRVSLHSSVLRFAVAERPIFLFHLDEIDKYVFASKLESVMQLIGDRLVKGTLFLNCAPH